MLARLRNLRLLAMSALAFCVLPACQGAGLFQRDRTALKPTPAVVPYSAYRPAYAPGPPKRTLFLGGYAGYNYNRAVPRGYVPTSHGVEVWGSPPTHREEGRHSWKP